MALVKYGIAVAQLSGTIAGNVFARNKGGNYVRKWTKPTAAPTPAQNTIRALFAIANAGYRALSKTQQTAWNQLASTHPFKNRLGEDILLSGQSCFMKSEMAILSANRFATVPVPSLTDAPADLNAPSPPKPPLDVQLSAAGDLMDLDFAESVVPAGFSYVVEATKDLPPSLIEVKNDYRTITTLAPGTAIQPVDIFQEWSAVFGTMTVGNSISIRVKTLDHANGILSEGTTAPPQIITA